MTLRRRLTTQWVLLLACLLLTAAAGVWGVAAVRSDFSVALANYERLRQLYQIGFYLQSARLALSIDFPDAPRARLECRRAQQSLTTLNQNLPVPAAKRSELEQAVAQAVQRLASPRPSVTALDLPLAKLQDVVDTLRQQIEDAQRAADRRQTQTRSFLLAVATLAAVASVALGLMLMRAVMRPLADIGAGVRRVARAQFDPPIDPHGSDREFAELARDFNDMATQLRTIHGELQQRVEAATRSLVQSERLAGVGLLAAGVAHEINNPLAIITGRLELLQSRTRDADVTAATQIAIDEAYRCKRIIERLLSLSRGPSRARQAVDLEALSRDVVDSVRMMPAATDRSIEVDASGPVTVHADAGELRQVLLNLLINALQSSEAGQSIVVSIRPEPGGAAWSVRDQGRGMSAEVLGRLFEPFYSARPGDLRGTGLGLSITKAIVESHGGTIEAHSDGDAAGSTFVVHLPIADNV